MTRLSSVPAVPRSRRRASRKRSVWKSAQAAIPFSRASRNYWIQQEELSGLRKNMEIRSIRKVDSTSPIHPSFLQSPSFEMLLCGAFKGHGPSCAFSDHLFVETALQH